MGHDEKLFNSEGWAVLDEWEGRAEIQWGEDKCCEAPCQVIALADGAPLVFCSFEGPVAKFALAASDRIDRLSIQYDGGFMQSEGSISTSILSAEDSVGYNWRLRPQRMTVWPEQDNASEPASLHFGLTNFTFPGSDDPPIRASLHLRELGDRDIVIEPVGDFPILKDRSSVLRSPHVTANLKLELKNEEEIRPAEKDAEDICWLLSLAQGCSVQWGKYDAVGEDGTVINQVYGSRKTAPYVPLPTVDSSVAMYLEETYPRYAERCDRWRLNRGIISAYLEARDETDDLETRAAKLVLALEMIVDRVGEAEGFEKKIVDDFDSLMKAMRDTLREEVPSEDQRRRLHEGLVGVNRVSFREKIDFLLEQVDAEFEDEEVRRIVKSRNSLVHKGEFYSRLPEDARPSNLEPLGSAEEEYFKMLDFMDKLMLRIVGYMGEIRACQ